VGGLKRFGEEREEERFGSFINLLDLKTCRFSF
jgi:hypothetical protein